MKHLPPNIIDFHVHLFPQKGFDAIWQYFDKAGVPILHKIYHEACIEYLHKRNVSPIVFCNYAHKKGIAEPMNQWNLETLDTFDDLYCFAAYHPDDDNALAYAEQVMSHPRVLGIKLHFQVQRIYPHDKRLFPLYEMVIQRKKRLLMHIGNGPSGNEYVGYALFSKVLDQYPHLPANLPHMGGYEFQAFIDLLADHPNLYLDTAYSFWPNLPFTFNLDKSYLEKYQDRILYGSDFPHIILPRRGEIDYLLNLELSEDFYRKIFYENGKRLIDACS